MSKKNSPVYLASGSPRRAEILTKYGVEFQVIANLLDPEPMVKSGSLVYIRKQLRQLAFQKADASKQAYQGVVIGADTVVVLDGQVLGKPDSIDQAVSMLKQLSGKTHVVVSSVCLLNTPSQTKTCISDVAEISFYALEEAQIREYCETHSVLDKAGGYAIQDIGHLFVKGYMGSYETIVGLPIHKMTALIK